MERPLEIAFHGLEHSDSVEAEIRKHVEKLETRYGRLTACRVSIEALHQQHQKGNQFEVHVILSVPGRELAVSHEPHRTKERYANPDVYTSLRDAFRAAERQLEGYKGHVRDNVASPGASALSGQVTLKQPGDDHGFILNSTGSQIYFHRDSVTDGDFEALREGDLVHYVEEAGSSGPMATKVRIGSSRKA